MLHISRLSKGYISNISSTVKGVNLKFSKNVADVIELKNKMCISAVKRPYLRYLMNQLRFFFIGNIDLDVELIEKTVCAPRLSK